MAPGKSLVPLTLRFLTGKVWAPPPQHSCCQGTLGKPWRKEKHGTGEGVPVSMRIRKKQQGLCPEEDASVQTEGHG